MKVFEGPTSGGFVPQADEVGKLVVTYDKPKKFVIRGTKPPRPRTPSPRMACGRNDPCPCGSGKKYKKCCITDIKYRVL